MSTRSIEGMYKALRVTVVGVLFIILLALVGISVDEVYAVVIQSLLLSNNVDKIILVGSLVIALVPFGYLSIYACIFIVICFRDVCKFLADRF